MQREIAATVLTELEARVGFLIDVGLGYLTLSRQMRTLSGGEAQRINLAGSLGSSLVDTLYVLDEPTIGLHPKDTGSLLDLLDRLRDEGNTVVVVEHETQAIERADHVIELGPASGEDGGEVVFEGTPKALREAETVTGTYLASGALLPDVARNRNTRGPSLELVGATLHNVRDANVDIPLGTLTVVTGVSGSGKSTLVHDILYRGLEKAFGDGETTAKQHLGEVVGDYDALRGIEHLENVVLVDQSPIGRTPRSNPVTYIGAWSDIRRIFSQQPLALDKGFGPGHFSFNITGGRCDACKGAGQVEIEMIFMADVFVPCEVCRGQRFKSTILDVKVKGKNVHEVLQMSVDEAIRFFLKEEKLGHALWQLQQVGLGYLRLGQPAPTLSGGEAQRLKIARELAASRGSRRKRRPSARTRNRSRKLFLLDEPTTGLSGPDVAMLLDVLNRLVEAGNTVVVIEHNLDLIRTADWLIDMGPGAGDQGGRVVAMGTPVEVAASKESVTAPYLRDLAKIP